MANIAPLIHFAPFYIDLRCYITHEFLQSMANTAPLTLCPFLHRFMLLYKTIHFCKAWRIYPLDTLPHFHLDLCCIIKPRISTLLGQQSYMAFARFTHCLRSYSMECHCKIIPWAKVNSQCYMSIFIHALCPNPSTIWAIVYVIGLISLILRANLCVSCCI